MHLISADIDTLQVHFKILYFFKSGARQVDLDNLCHNMRDCLCESIAPVKQSDYRISDYLLTGQTRSAKNNASNKHRAILHTSDKNDTPNATK